jgi:hypothetical protein
VSEELLWCSHFLPVHIRLSNSCSLVAKNFSLIFFRVTETHYGVGGNALKRAGDSLFLFEPAKLHLTRKNLAKNNLILELARFEPASSLSGRARNLLSKHLTHPKSCDYLL